MIKKRVFIERAKQAINEFLSNGIISDTFTDDKDFMDTLKTYVTENPESIFDIIKNTKQLNLRFKKGRKNFIKNILEQNATMIFACHNLKKIATWRWKIPSNISNISLYFQNFIYFIKIANKKQYIIF